MTEVEAHMASYCLFATIINGRLPIGSTNFRPQRWLLKQLRQDGKGHALMALINVRNSAHVMTLV